MRLSTGSGYNAPSEPKGVEQLPGRMGRCFSNNEALILRPDGHVHRQRQHQCRSVRVVSAIHARTCVRLVGFPPSYPQHTIDGHQRLQIEATTFRDHGEIPTDILRDRRGGLQASRSRALTAVEPRSGVVRWP